MRRRKRTDGETGKVNARETEAVQRKLRERYERRRKNGWQRGWKCVCVEEDGRLRKGGRKMEKMEGEGARKIASPNRVRECQKSDKERAFVCVCVC